MDFLREAFKGGNRFVVIALTALGVFFASSTLKHDAPGIALVCLIVYIASLPRPRTFRAWRSFEL